jgi:CRP-like cAMP-binding protein
MAAISQPDDLDLRSWRKVLTSHGWLSRTSDAFQAALLADVVWHAFEPGEHLTMAGDESRRELFGLCEGVVALTAGLGPGDTPPLHLARPAFWFGHSMLSTGEPTRVTATARTRGTLVRIPGQRILTLVGGRPDWWLHLLQLTAIYGDVAVTVATDLAIRGSERRLVAVLLRMGGHRDPATGPALRVVPVNQVELAAACNLSRNTANGIVRRLASRGLLSVTRAGLAIDDPDELLRLATL